MAKLIKVGVGQKAEGKGTAIAWNEDRTFKEVVGDKPVVGCSFMVGNNQIDYWLTTLVTEIVEEREGYIRFNTENSVYEFIV